jgi:signal transduction histidine kinase
VWRCLWQASLSGVPRPGKGPECGRTVVFAIALLGIATLGAPASAATKIKHVLIIYANDRLLPATVEGDIGIREGVAESDPTALLSDEFLDIPIFDAQAYHNALMSFLRAKYSQRVPSVIVAAGEEAIDFLLRNRSELFPLTPIVHVGVAKSFLQQELPLPPDVIGVPVDYEFRANIEQALQWRPQARRLVVVTGASSSDHLSETELRGVASRFQDRVTVEFLTGQPTSSVLRRLGQLDDDAIVFTPGYFEDGEGRGFTPRESVRLMASAATAPVFGPFSTFIGTGVVGGRMPNYRAMGRQAGIAVGRLLKGEIAPSLHLPEVMAGTVNVDWRQLARWGISEKSLPSDAIVQFREPSVWDTHPQEVMLTAAVFVLLTALIAVLLIERRLRHRADSIEAKLRADLTRAMRLALAGELTGSIAHEINQPLGAILSNIAAAELMLRSGLDRRDDLRAILADIRQDNLRASEVIRRLRALFTKQQLERTSFRIDEAVGDAAIFLRGEAQRRRIALYFRPPLSNASIVGDRIAIAQMLMNLVLNAMDAVADLPEDQRSIVVSAEMGADAVRIRVRDRGRGIDPTQLPKLFDSFFTTKRGGMGMGLSIVRTIVDVHNGKVWAENDKEGGAAFYVELPVAMIAEVALAEAT